LFAAIEACDCGRMANHDDRGRLRYCFNHTLSPASA